jgi:hypothetical protein
VSEEGCDRCRRQNLKLALTVRDKIGDALIDRARPWTVRGRHVMFEKSEEQLAIRYVARRFIEEEIGPNVEELERGCK